MSMRTTIDLSDELLRLAKRRAVDEGTTLKAVFEDGAATSSRGGLAPATA
jgi:hypothetical protein